MKKTGFFLLILALCMALRTTAQDSVMTDAAVKTPQIAVFAPLYLDSAYDAAGNYRYGKMLPRYLNAGLDFYQGVAFAVDSLDKEELEIQVNIYDTKAKTSIFKLADSGALDSTDIILGAVSGAEYLDLATIAREKKIPFFSVTYPNDGGVRENPYVLIVNPRLNTHLQALYHYVLKNHGTDNIVLLRKKGAADDRVSGVFKSLNETNSDALLKIREVILNTDFTPENIAAVLNKDKENLIIGGSLDDAFGKKLIAAASSLNAGYKITLLGMPTWAGFNELESAEAAKIPIVLSASFFNPEAKSAFVTAFAQRYANATYTYPSEAAFRGFELMYQYGHLLERYQKADLFNNISTNEFQVLIDFDFKPVYVNKQSISPDFYENKRIYLIRRLNESIEKLN